MKKNGQTRSKAAVSRRGIKKRAPKAKSAFQGETFHRDVLNALSAHVAVLDSQGVIVAVNEAWRRFARENGGDFANGYLGENYLAAIRPNTEFAEAVAQGIRAVMNRTQPSFLQEYRCDSIAEQRWFLMIVRPVSEPLGGVVVAHENITVTKQSEFALRESEEKFRRIVSSANEGVGVLDAEFRFTLANDYLVQMLGFSREETIGQRMDRFLFAEDVLENTQRMQRRQGGLAERYEQRFRCRNGRELWTSISATPLLDSEGRFCGAFAMISDLTERKRAEAALRQSEQNYREIYNAVNDAIFYHDAKSGAILDVNDTMLRMYGYSREEALRLKPCDLGTGESPYSAAEASQWIVKAATEGPQLFEWQGRHKNGKILWVEVALKVTQISGHNRMLALARDITARKQAETQLSEIQSLLLAAVDQSPAGIVIADAPEGTIRVANSAAVQIRGETKDPLTSISIEAYARNWGIMRPDGQPFSKEELPLARAVLHGKTSQNVEAVIHRQHGENRWILGNAAPVHNSQGKLIAGISIFVDITERKRATEALRESEERYRRLFECSPMAIYVECDGRIAFINSAGLELFGAASPDQIIGKRSLELIHPEWRDSATERLSALRSGHESVPPIARRYLRLDGSAVEVEVAATRFVLNGKLAVLAIASDVTPRKVAEEALNAAHQRLLDTIEMLPDATFILDENRRIIAWNRACEQLTGVPHQEMLGKGDAAHSVPFYGERRVMLIDLIGTESPAQEALYTYVKRVGDRLYAESFAPLLNQGQGVYLWGVAAPLFNQKGQRFGAIEMVRDITERKQIEEKLRQLSSHLLNLQDAESRRIARELHDSTAQKLAALHINLSLLKSLLAKANARIGTLLLTCVEIAHECTQEIRTMSYLLHPPLLEELGLADAIREYADGFAARSGLRVDLELPMEITVLPRTVELALFRILQESLSNIWRHSGSKTASIILTQDSSQIQLEVRDAGHGFSAAKEVTHNLPIAENRGVGIASMRERLLNLGGVLMIESKPGETVVKAIIPTKGNPLLK